MLVSYSITKFPAFNVIVSIFGICAIVVILDRSLPTHPRRMDIRVRSYQENIHYHWCLKDRAFLSALGHGRVSPFSKKDELRDACITKDEDYDHHPRMMVKGMLYKP
jgi:hypothetical protein